MFPASQSCTETQRQPPTISLLREWLFRLGIAVDLICHTLFIFVAVALYNLLKGINQRHALLMVILICSFHPNSISE